MFKYIYVFILIVILFGIKWKLQKKYEFKEEFDLTPEEAVATRNKLTDMFSSSAAQPSFRDKLNIINSNIKFDFNSNNLSWNLDTSATIWFQHDTNHYSRIELHPGAQGIGFGDSNISGIHDKVLTSVNNDKLSFELQRFSLPAQVNPLWNSNFASFDINSNNTSNINESLSNLKSWHIPVISYKGYSGEPFAANPSNFIDMWNNLTLSECHTLCDSNTRCVGFAIGNTTPGTCTRYHTSITLDYTRSDRTTYLKP